MLNGVLIEEVLFRDRKAPIIQWKHVSGSGRWSIDASARGGQTIRIVTTTGQEIVLRLGMVRRKRMALAYRPDPEMAEPFVFTRVE